MGPDCGGCRWCGGRIGFWQIERRCNDCSTSDGGHVHRQSEHQHRASVMKAFLIALSIAPVALWAQLATPQIGFIQDSGNALRPVYGIAGNFVLGDSAAAGVQAASFSGSFGMLKTRSTLIVIDRQGQVVASQDAPAGPALFAFSRTGAPALAYLPDANVLLQWLDGVFQQVPLDPPTNVLS